MKTTLVFAFALIAVAFARSMTDEKLLQELRDVLKRQIGQGPPQRPQVSCQGGADFRDVIRNCTAPFRELNEDDKRQMGPGQGRHGGPGGPGGPRMNPYCHLQMKIGADADIVAECVQQQCDIPEEYQYQNIECPVSCQNGQAFFDVLDGCLAPYGLGEEDKRQRQRGPPTNHYCRLVAAIGATDAAAVGQCVQDECTIPTEMQYQNQACSGQNLQRQPGNGPSRCEIENLASCSQAAGLSPPSEDQEHRRPRGNPFCHAVQEHGAQAAESVSQCLNTACGSPLRYASDCPPSESESLEARQPGNGPSSCERENLATCAQAAGLSPPSQDQEHRRPPGNPFCHAVQEHGAQAAESVSRCLNTACGSTLRYASECTASKRQQQGRPDFQCIVNNIEACAATAGVQLPNRPDHSRTVRGMGQHFCRAVENFGATKAEALNNCLSVCDLPARSASECTDDLKRKLMKLLSLA